MNIGPIIQLRVKDAVSTFMLEKTSPILLYSTLARGGYIMRMRPIASGKFVVPVENEFINVAEEGAK